MKKVFVTILSVLLLTVILPFGDTFNNTVDADSYYPIGCAVDEFEVSYVQDDGDLSTVSCHSTFAEAKTQMKKNNDYVVRYAKSYSPTKIVAMNSGVAYTYPGRRDSLTMYLYQDISQGSSNERNYKYTYLTENFEMTYFDTLTEYSGSLSAYGKGYIKIAMNGFEGYCELEYTDLVPSKYLEKEIPIILGGNNVYNGEEPYTVIMSQNYYTLENRGNYVDLVFHYFRAYPDKTTDRLHAISNELYVDNAANYIAAGMRVGTRYYSYDGINFYSDRLMKNFVAQVYGYYQYLSLRSKTNVSASALNGFLSTVRSADETEMYNQGQTFINSQNNYGSNALLIYAMACQESGYGSSFYASDRYNLFGWGAYDSKPNHANSFESIEQCVNQHMGRNLNWFMDCTNWRYAGTCIGNKGTGINVQYSSDPYWGAKIASIAYRIDKFSNNNNGKLSDYNNYTIGLVDANYNASFGVNTANWNTPIYSSATGNDILYYSKFNNNYQKDLTVVINEKVGNRYKINIANPIINGSMYVDDECVPYDWNKSVAYIDCNRVSIINNKNTTVKANATYEKYNCVNSLSLNNNILTIEGLGVIQGTDFNTVNGSRHQIVFYSFIDNSEIAVFDAENIDSDGYDMNDGYNYKYAGFKASIDLTDEQLDIGNYYLALRTTNEGHTVEETLKTSNSKYRNRVSTYNDITYKLTANLLSSYRLEIDILSTPLDYTKISKPSARSSTVSFDSITLDENGDLEICGQGLIEYLDFSDLNKIEYNVYLVKDNQDYLKLSTSFNSDDKTDYTSALNSDYDLSYISFKSTTKDLEINTFDLVAGRYSLLLEIKNSISETLYIDILEFTNRGNAPLNNVTNENKDISLNTSSIRKRIELVVSDKD